MLRALLRRSLRDWDAALSLELIVAGQNGGPPARETSLAARILDGAKQRAGAAAQSFEADGRWIYGLSLAQGIAAVVLVETEIPASGLAGW